jgi:hypothetical protein
MEGADGLSVALGAALTNDALGFGFACRGVDPKGADGFIGVALNADTAGWRGCLFGLGEGAHLRLFGLWGASLGSAL